MSRQLTPPGISTYEKILGAFFFPKTKGPVTAQSSLLPLSSLAPPHLWPWSLFPSPFAYAPSFMNRRRFGTFAPCRRPPSHIQAANPSIEITTVAGNFYPGLSIVPRSGPAQPIARTWFYSSSLSSSLLDRVLIYTWVCLVAFPPGSFLMYSKRLEYSAPYRDLF
jgi:hypothetical protein